MEQAITTKCVAGRVFPGVTDRSKNRLNESYSDRKTHSCSSVTYHDDRFWSIDCLSRDYAIIVNIQHPACTGTYCTTCGCLLEFTWDDEETAGVYCNHVMIDDSTTVDCMINAAI